MKKVIVILIAIVAINISVQAQKLNAAKVPAAVKASFTKQYPGSIASWEKEGGNYEANFKMNGSNISATFEPNGIFMESEIDIKLADLPAVVLSYVKEHYNGSAIKEAAKITKADGTVNYEAEVNGKDVIFDASGKFMKTVKN